MGERNGVRRVGGQAKDEVGGDQARFGPSIGAKIWTQIGTNIRGRIAIDIETKPMRRRHGPMDVRDLAPGLAALENWWT
jgi:hypothetical protein